MKTSLAFWAGFYGLVLVQEWELSVFGNFPLPNPLNIIHCYNLGSRVAGEVQSGGEGGGAAGEGEPPQSALCLFIIFFHAGAVEFMRAIVLNHCLLPPTFNQQLHMGMKLFLQSFCLLPQTPPPAPPPHIYYNVSYFAAVLYYS